MVHSYFEQESKQVVYIRLNSAGLSLNADEDSNLPERAGQTAQPNTNQILKGMIMTLFEDGPGKNSIRTSCLMVTLVMLSFATGSSTVANERIDQMQQVIDDADEKIRQIRDQLSVPGLSTDAITQLNRLMKDQQWAKAQAQKVIVKERERMRKGRNRQTTIRTEILAYNQRMNHLNQRRRTLNTAYSSLIKEAGHYKQKVFEHNNNPNRTDERAAYLKRWRDELWSRGTNLDRKNDQLEREYRELANRKKRIQSM